jgi:hypothetical protein
MDGFPTLPRIVHPDLGNSTRLEAGDHNAPAFHPASKYSKTRASFRPVGPSMHVAQHAS